MAGRRCGCAAACSERGTSHGPRCPYALVRSCRRDGRIRCRAALMPDGLPTVAGQPGLCSGDSRGIEDQEIVSAAGRMSLMCYQPCSVSPNLAHALGPELPCCRPLFFFLHLPFVHFDANKKKAGPVNMFSVVIGPLSGCHSYFEQVSIHKHILWKLNSL